MTIVYLSIYLTAWQVDIASDASQQVVEVERFG
jgi:hypothetical protein